MCSIPALLKSAGLAAALTALLPQVASAQLTSTPDWTVSTPGSTAPMIAVDGGSNAYVAGSVTGATMTLTKIGPAGTPLWQRTFDGAGPLSQSTSVTLDGAGNAIVTGRILGALNAPVGQVVLKYDPAGALQWQDVTPSAYGAALRAATDAAGNVYVLGHQGQPTAVESVVIKYSATGVRLWSQVALAAGLQADALAITPSGNVIVSGPYYGYLFLEAFDSAGTYLSYKLLDARTSSTALATGAGGELYAVGSGTQASLAPGFLAVKLDASFNEVWRVLHPARGYAAAAALDPAGNLVVAGPVDTNVCPPGQFCTQSVNYDWMTIKLDPTGALLWSRTRGGPYGFASNNDVPRDVAAGPDGSIYVTGEGVAPVAYLGGSYYLRSTMTVKYGPDGTELWAANEASPSVVPWSNRGGVGVRLGGDGGVFVLGDLPQTVFRYGQYGLPNQPPLAKASATPATGAAPLKVAFGSAGSLDPDGLVAGYAWNFGDGQTSTAANPSHTYAAGTYTASLVVTDTLGAASAPASVTVTASAPPPAKPTSLTLARATVTGGLGTTATVKVSSAAGVTVALSSSNATAARVPATVVVPAGSTSATVTITTSKVGRDTPVTLRATASGATASATLTVRR